MSEAAYLRAGAQSWKILEGAAGFLIDSARETGQTLWDVFHRAHVATCRPLRQPR